MRIGITDRNHRNNLFRRLRRSFHDAASKMLTLMNTHHTLACAVAILSGLPGRIRTAVVDVAVGSDVDSATVNGVAEATVQLVTRLIRARSVVLRDLIDSPAVGLVGGRYDLQSGEVRFFHP